MPEKIKPKLSRTQEQWLERLKRRGRIRYGGYGMPIRTADALERMGLVIIEPQRIFLKHDSKALGLFVIEAPNR